MRGTVELVRLDNIGITGVVNGSNGFTVRHANAEIIRIIFLKFQSFIHPSAAGQGIGFPLLAWRVRNQMMLRDDEKPWTDCKGKRNQVDDRARQAYGTCFRARFLLASSVRAFIVELTFIVRSFCVS